nr:AtpZ/AtpI family protein [uncultured Tyzzerella sp.]
MKNDFQGYAIYSQFGFIIITTVLIGIYFGKKLDAIFNTQPIFLLTFIILAIITGFINFFYKVMKSFNDEQSYKNKYIHIVNFILETFSSIILCFFIGNFLDKKYNNNNFFTILFIFVTLIFNILIFIKKFKLKHKLTFGRKNNENF